VELILVHRIIEFSGSASDLRSKNQKQQNVSDVQMPGPHQKPFGGGEKIAGLNDRTVDVARQIAGNEHEEFRSIAEAVVTKRQPADDVVRNVIEENHPQAKAPV